MFFVFRNWEKRRKKEKKHICPFMNDGNCELMRGREVGRSNWKHYLDGIINFRDSRETELKCVRKENWMGGEGEKLTVLMRKKYWRR